MTGKKRLLTAATALVLSLVGVWWAFAKDPTHQEQRDGAREDLRGGQLQGRLRGPPQARPRPQGRPARSATTSTLAISCLQQPRPRRRDRRVPRGRHRRPRQELAAARRPRPAATSAAEHYGFIVAGKFYRGHKRGGGRYVNACQRDRVRALQLMHQAPAARREGRRQGRRRPVLPALRRPAAQRRRLPRAVAAAVPDRPDASCPTTRRATTTGARQRTSGAPVDDDGKPVFHHVPKSCEAARPTASAGAGAGAGRRVRPRPRQRGRHDSSPTSCSSQFGVQTMAHVRLRAAGGDDDKDDDKTGTFALHTLKDDETIAKLATGIKRFKLPDEFNSSRSTSSIADRGKTGLRRAGPATRWPQSFEDRRQYVKAADAWKQAIDEYGPGQQQLPPATASTRSSATGAASSTSRRSRPARRRDRRLPLPQRQEGRRSRPTRSRSTKLLDDVKAYLKTQPRPARLATRSTSATSATGWSQQNQKQYLGEQGRRVGRST